MQKPTTVQKLPGKTVKRNGYSLTVGKTKNDRVVLYFDSDGEKCQKQIIEGYSYWFFGEWISLESVTKTGRANLLFEEG